MLRDSLELQWVGATLVGIGIRPCFRESWDAKVKCNSDGLSQCACSERCMLVQPLAVSSSFSQDPLIER